MKTKEETELEIGLDKLDIEFGSEPAFYIDLACCILLFPVVWCYDKFMDWRFERGLRAR